MKADLKETIEIPDGVEVKLNKLELEVRGQYGAVRKKLVARRIGMTLKDKAIELSAKNAKKRQKTMLYTYAAHIRNMMKGAAEGHHYVLKICSGHFPINVRVVNDEFIVKNFIGEKTPRRLKLPSEVKVKVEADMVRVEGADKEVAGQCAASIEQLTRRPGFDKRIFQDGIYIVEKDRKKIR